jgi:hypothetical protein
VGNRGSVSRRAGDVVESSLSQEQWLCSTLLMTTRKVSMYENYQREAYMWHTWTGAESVHVVCIKFPLQDVHQF